MKRLRSTPGFSLVETLVAMFLFVLAVGILAQAANNAITAISTMEIKDGRQNDYAFVRDQLLTISDTQQLSAGGDVQTPAAGDANWQAETGTTSYPDVFAVTLSITLPGNGEEVPPESSNETLFLLRPQWSATDDRSALLSQIHDNLTKMRTQQSWP